MDGRRAVDSRSRSTRRPPKCRNAPLELSRSGLDTRFSTSKATDGQADKILVSLDFCKGRSVTVASKRNADSMLIELRIGSKDSSAIRPVSIHIPDELLMFPLV